MKNYTFHFEVEDILQQFAAALNDIIVKRYNNDREPQDQIYVNFLYSPKTRTLNEIINKAQHIKLPCISISLGGIKRNKNRVFNKLDGSWWRETLTHNPSAVNWINLLQPVPVDITVNVSIISRFQSDVDQILANFIPYTDPYFVISWKWPDDIPIADFEIRSIVNWSENVNFQYPVEVSKETSYWTIADTSFTIESWMFKNIPPDGKPIYVIDFAFSSVSAIETYDFMKSFESEYNTDYFTISARPQSINIDPYYTYIGGDAVSYEKNFSIVGKMMDYVESVYLSSADWNMFNCTTTGDFVTSGPQLISSFSVSSFYASAAYPPFSGIEMLSSNWTAIDKNFLDFSFTPLQTGIFDVILLNHAGYGILSNDCIRPVLNPYKEGSEEYNNYIEYQYPCTSGVEIRGL
jgi:hypothetical protein